MLLRALQRLVRLAPSATRLVWNGVPERARHALSPLIHPIATGGRGSGFLLDVPAGRTTRSYDVVLSGESLMRSAAAPWIEAARAAGNRVQVLGAAPPEPFVRAERILDGVYVPLTGEAPERAAAMRRFGLRIAEESFLAGGGSPFAKVSVIVATHDSASLLAACLRALRRNTPWPGLEVIVIDNGSRDGTAALLRAEDGATVITNAGNRGFAPAANQGLARATGDIVVLLNDDTAVGPGWLSRLVAHLESDPKLGLVCPVTNEIGNEAKIPVMYRDFDEMERFVEERAFDHVGERRATDTVALFCAAARRETLAGAGFLDERYAIGMFEDDDLSRTLGLAGLGRAIAHDAFVHHVGQASFSRLSDAEYLSIWQANRRRFEQKWGVKWSPPERA